MEKEGTYSLVEIQLHESEGPPLHYHNSFSEKSEATESDLYLQVGKEKKILKPGDAITVPKGTHHKFYNVSDDLVKFNITFQPGWVGMENFINIIYSLAQDGLTDKKGKPKSFAHLASILVMSDSNAPRMLSLLSPVIRMVAKRAEKEGTEKWLLDKCCS